MAKRLFLHVGAPKSGTTYLQSLLWANKDKLSAAGVLVPGQFRFDHNRMAQAVRFAEPDPKAHRAWHRMWSEIDAWPGTAVLSNEWFCTATQAQVGRTIDAFSPSEIHVIATARDLVRTVPSAWQESLKLGFSRSLVDFIDALGQPGSRWRWSTLDPSLTLPRWQAFLPRGRVHLVTVPSGGGRPELLWQRFAGLLDLHPDDYDLDVGSRNESLGAESARLLELVGTRLRDGIDADNITWNQAYIWIREFVSHDLLVPQGGSRIGISAAELELIRGRSRQSIRRLAAAHYEVVGDLDELVEASISADAVRPDDVPDAAVLELTANVMAGLLARARQESIRADVAERKAATLEDQAGAWPRRRKRS